MVYTVRVNSFSQPPAKVIALREFLRTKFPEAHAPQAAPVETLRTGVSCLDVLGLGKGAITEVVGTQPGCGIGLLIAALLQRESSGIACGPTALIDGSDAFDPWSVPAETLERLLWVRCRETMQAVKATDLLLRDGNIHLVLLDLQMQPLPAVQSLPSSIWHRLRLLAEKSGASLCAFTPCRIVPGVRSRVIVEHPFTLADLYQPPDVLAARLPARVERQQHDRLLRSREANPALQLDARGGTRARSETGNRTAAAPASKAIA